MKFEMNEAERKLVGALRGGRYAQTRGGLRDPHGLCCLGVACDISGLGKWDSHDCYRIGENESSVSFLPEAVREWLGWYGRDGATEYDAVNLAALNDEGATFNQIADVIEAGLVKRAGECIPREAPMAPTIPQGASDGTR